MSNEAFAAVLELAIKRAGRENHVSQMVLSVKGRAGEPTGMVRIIVLPELIRTGEAAENYDTSKVGK